MEKFHLLIKQARNQFNTADHLAYVTYPMVKETKMLFVIVENLYKTSLKIISAILHRERLYKRITLIPLEWPAKIKLFEKLAPRYKITENQITAVKNLWQIIQKHKESPMVFSRGEKFVITGDNFKIHTVDINLLKKYVIEIRTLLVKVEAILK